MNSELKTYVDNYLKHKEECDKWAWYLDDEVKNVITKYAKIMRENGDYSYPYCDVIIWEIKNNAISGIVKNRDDNDGLERKTREFCFPLSYLEDPSKLLEFEKTIKQQNYNKNIEKIKDQIKSKEQELSELKLKIGGIK